MTENNSIKKVISTIKSELNGIYQEVEVSSFINLIFEELLGYSRAKLLISLDEELNQENLIKINSIIDELKLQKPIQHILGKTIFYDLSFKVNHETLIPRPETEELVDWIISENKNTELKILDIGTGTGCIAVSIAKNLPGSTIYAVDISEKAISLAKENAALNKLKIQCLILDILNPQVDIKDKFDIIVSNPPYVTEKEKRLMQKNVLNFEPALALFVPDDKPLLFYEAITNFGLNHLNPGGKIYFEINEAYGKEMIELLENKGFKNTSLRKDINNKPRMIRGILN